MTHVVTLKTNDGREAHFPAWQRTDGIMLDLRMLDQNGKQAYLPDKLRQCGIDEQWILAAAESLPQGFVLRS